MGDPLALRFWAKVDSSGGTGACWLWTGRPTAAGYGRISVLGGTERAHRVSYELNVGPIPVGFEVRHSCDNPPCVNPAHLLLGTHAENMGDMADRKRHPRLCRTHCKYGHEYTEANTRIDIRNGRSYRVCRRCAVIRCAERRKAGTASKYIRGPEARERHRLEEIERRRTKKEAQNR